MTLREHLDLAEARAARRGAARRLPGVVQEGLTNARKHAPGAIASNVIVTGRRRPGW